MSETGREPTATTRQELNPDKRAELEHFRAEVTKAAALRAEVTELRGQRTGAGRSLMPAQDDGMSHRLDVVVTGAGPRAPGLRQGTRPELRG